MEFYTTEQVSNLLGIQPNTLEIWRHRGTGPKFIKMGRLVRYKSNDLEAWIDSQTRQNTSQAGDPESPVQVAK
ncbi:MAG: helix-turn-helix domain-containing protein [Desulfosalsimonas sp.]|uniref:helix-turn-helix transcriptional regulator n=1 Tax=Desulfosalsimonas sp. TaxID=3073848 RepID=UPI003970C092